MISFLLRVAYVSIMIGFAYKAYKSLKATIVRIKRNLLLNKLELEYNQLLNLDYNESDDTFVVIGPHKGKLAKVILTSIEDVKKYLKGLEDHNSSLLKNKEKGV